MKIGRLILIILIAIVISLLMGFGGYVLSLSALPPFSRFTGVIVIPLITFAVVFSLLILNEKLNLKMKKAFNVFRKQEETKDKISK